MFAPDHWVPASILAWQRGWSKPRTLLFSSALILPHILLGALIYFALDAIAPELPYFWFLAGSMVWIALVASFRVYRYRRIREILRNGSKGLWGAYRVFTLLGPCETLLPVLLKAREKGGGYLLPGAGFFLGAWLAGLALILFGRRLWDQPIFLSRSLNLSRGKMTWVPLATALSVAWVLWMR